MPFAPIWSVRGLQQLSVLVLLFIVAACSSSDGEPADGTETSGDGTTVVGATGRGLGPNGNPLELECERGGYPCTWDQADAGATLRTDELLAFSSLLLTEGATAEEIATRLEAAPGVAEVIFDPITVWFRVDGAVPVFVYVDPTDGGLIEAAIPAADVDTTRSIRPSGPAAQQAQQAQFTGCAQPGEERTDGAKGPVGRTGEPKKALILGPWKWQMDWDADQLSELLKLGRSDYEQPGGGVQQIMTDVDGTSAFFGGNDAVRLEHFCNWGEFDTIILKTHGRAVCDDGGACHTGLSVGRFTETRAELRAWAGGAHGVTFGTSRYGNLNTSLTPDQIASCIERLERSGEDGSAPPDAQAADDCLERLDSAGHLEVTTDFFIHNYAGGLKDRMIFFSACQGMKAGDLAPALRGTGDSSGAILGFDQIIQTRISNKVLEQFAEWVATGRAIDQKALARLNQIVDDMGADADVTGAIEGEFAIDELADVVPDGPETTRGADIVSLHQTLRGPELIDGGQVDIDGTPGDGDDDRLKFAARLTGIGDEGPTEYPIEILLDGRVLNLEDYEWRIGDREGTFDAEVVAQVGGDLVPETPVVLEIRTVLPDTGGAFSRWEYEDIRVGAKPGAVISVGGTTWEFELTTFFGRVCDLGPDDSKLVTAGFVDGDLGGTSFSAHLEPAGHDVEGLFSVHGVTVQDQETGADWMADDLEFPSLQWLADIPAGGSQIDSITIAGGHAFGTATFIDVNAARLAWSNNTAPPNPVGGSFDIQCGS